MRIEFRAAILISLLTLLWLSIEYLIGLQDRFLSIYPYVTLLSVVIAFWCYRRAFNEKKIKLDGNFGLKQVWLCGIIITFFTCLLAIPVQFIFQKGINPDFIPTMLDYSIHVARQRPEVAALFINFNAYVTGSVLFALISGLLITLILSFTMRTSK